MKSIIVIFATSLLLSACTNTAQLTREHNVWKQKLDSLPIGANKTQIKQWADTNQIPLEWNNHLGDYSARKEVRSWWCTQFVSLKIEINEQHLVKDKTSQQYGKCGF